MTVCTEVLRPCVEYSPRIAREAHRARVGQLMITIFVSTCPGVYQLQLKLGQEPTLSRPRESLILQGFVSGAVGALAVRGINWRTGLETLDCCTSWESKLRQHGTCEEPANYIDSVDI
jgi:hypothetical protein